MNSNQFFRYKPDKVIVSFIEKMTSSSIFKISNYSISNDSLYVYNKIEDKEESFKIVSSDDSFDVYYSYGIYDCLFSKIDIDVLDAERYNKLFLYSIVDTNSIEIFNFMP